MFGRIGGREGWRRVRSGICIVRRSSWIWGIGRRCLSIRCKVCGTDAMDLLLHSMYLC